MSELIKCLQKARDIITTMEENLGAGRPGFSCDFIDEIDENIKILTRLEEEDHTDSGVVAKRHGRSMSWLELNLENEVLRKKLFNQREELSVKVTKALNYYFGGQLTLTSAIVKSVVEVLNEKET